MQDRWTFKRATITGGLRYDYFVGYVNDSTLPPSRWNPAQFFPGFEVQHWKDLSPRVGVAYDLFGDGRTAIKASIARYVAPESNGTAQANNPQTTIGRTDTRTWRDLNGDYTIYNADGSVQSDELGPTSNVNFGKVIPTHDDDEIRATLDGLERARIDGRVAARRAASADADVGRQRRLLPPLLRQPGGADNTLDHRGRLRRPVLHHRSVTRAICREAAAIRSAASTTSRRPRARWCRTTRRSRGTSAASSIGTRASTSASTCASAGGTFVNGGVNMQQRVLDKCDMPVSRTTRQVDSPEAPLLPAR